MSKTRGTYLSRNGEGRNWYRIDEDDKTYTIAVTHCHDNIVNIRKIRKTDYARIECYPHYLPSFTLEKEF